MTDRYAKHWTWEFDAEPMAVWTVLADTARFNEAAGFPKHEISERKEPDGGVSYIGTAKISGFNVAWRDIPLEWIEGERFTHRSEFFGTPIKSLAVTLTLTEENDGTRADYLLEVEPRNWIGRILARYLLRSAEPTYARLASELAAYLKGRKPAPFETPAEVFTPSVKRRVDTAITQIAATGCDLGLAERLAAYVRDAQEVDLMHIRPLKLARDWSLTERDIIEVCLEAVNAGLLGMDWQLLCPRCRGAKVNAPRLGDLPPQAHCESCSIDYEREFATNVELTFHPAPAIRQIDRGEFCLFGPMSTPHVKLQQTLGPGRARRVDFTLPPGGYRIRTLNGAGAADIDHDGGALPSVTMADHGVRLDPHRAAGQIVIENTSAREQTAVVEEREWARDALTAHRVTSMQLFRDLFGGDVLRPGDEIAVDTMTFLFTDLKGSTTLYNQIGDARAYQLVRHHFDYLRERVRRHNGAIVKTVGDAVMAAFADPVDALQAGLEIQRNLTKFNEESSGTPIVIKMGLHAGPSIAVTSNDGIDYFGATVNLAARLEKESRGSDIILSESLAQDPGVIGVLAQFKPTKDKASLKGFDDEIPITRIDVAPDSISDAA